MNVIIKIVLYVKNTIINDRIKYNKYILYCAVGTLFLFWHLFFCLVVVFVDFWKSVFLCYFLVNLCISLRKVRCISKFPIYRHLRRYLEGVGGEVEPSLPVWCKRTFFQKKKKIKIANFVKYCVMELTYIVMIVGGYSFCCQKKEKKEKSYVLVYVKAVRKVIKSRHCLYILYFVLLLSVIGFDFCHFLGT